MKKIIILIQCIALMILSVPIFSYAEGENGYYIRYSRKYTHPWANNEESLSPYNTEDYEIYVPDSNARVFIVAFYDDLNNIAKQMVFSIGADIELTINRTHTNGYFGKTTSETSTISLKDLKNYDLLSEPLNKVTYSNTGGVNLYDLGLNGGYSYPEYYGVNGTLCAQPQELGYLTLGGLKIILDNLDDYKIQPEEYDETLGVPSFLHHKDSLREYLSVTNPSGKKIEMNIKIYGPSSIYIESISKNPLDKGLDMYEFAVTSEIGSNYVSADGFSDSCDFYMWGLENSSITEGENYVFLGGMFSDFTQSCASNCEFEYKDYFTQIQDSANKLQWDMLLTLANSNLYEYEIYARFYDDSGSVKKYGSWQHLVLERGGNFKQGTDEDGVVDIPDDEEDNRDDDDLIPIIPEQPDYSEFDVTGLWEFIATLANSLGQVPAIVSQIFSFLPDWIIYMVGFGIAAIVILRFLGR